MSAESNRRKFAQKLSSVPTEHLYTHYERQTSPFTQYGIGAPEHQSVAEELRRRGVDPATITVAPRGVAAPGKKTVLQQAGGVLKKVAPVAAAFIPGIGPVAAGALAAGGSAAGRALEGKKFSLGQTALAGLGGGVGSHLVHGGGGVSGALGRAKDLIKSGASKAGGLVSKASQAAGGPLNLAQLGLAGLSTIQAGQAGGRQDAALTRALSSLPGDELLQRPDTSDIFADENPYGGLRKTNRAARSAARALSGGY